MSTTKYLCLLHQRGNVIQPMSLPVGQSCRFAGPALSSEALAKADAPSRNPRCAVLPATSNFQPATFFIKTGLAGEMTHLRWCPQSAADLQSAGFPRTSINLGGSLFDAPPQRVAGKASSLTNDVFLIFAVKVLPPLWFSRFNNSTIFRARRAALSRHSFNDGGSPIVNLCAFASLR